LNRAIETRGQNDSDPVLSNLRDSGSIEQDAVIVAFIRNHWRNPTRAQIMAFPENVVNGEPAPRLKAIPVRFHFAKNRNGEMGVSDIIKWNKANGRFQTLQHGAQV
jgi:replicative DNA helicase